MSGPGVQIEGWPPDVAEALADAYAAGWWDAVQAQQALVANLPADWRSRGARSGALALGDPDDGPARVLDDEQEPVQ